MVPIVSLWLPILLSAVFVFVVSSIIHVVLRYHRNDFAPLPDEEGVRAALNRHPLTPGQYGIPCPGDMKKMQDPEWIRKYEEGPVAFITVRPKGIPSMPKHLLLWFLFSIGIAVFVAYIAGRTMPPGTTYRQIFRITGAIAFLGYAGGLVWAGIWKAVPWSKVLKDVFDSLIFALLTAGAFAQFWPR